MILPFLCLNFILCRSSTAGIKKARVFPEPVRAAPSTSFPARRGGIDCSCTGVMVLKPISSRPFIVGSESSSVSKDTRPAMPSCGTVVGADSELDIELVFVRQSRVVYVGFLSAQKECDRALSRARRQ
jgi:hypothetical protein